MNIYIVKNGVNLYPEHIYEWKISGINCPTEDYSIGNVSVVKITFKTDEVFAVGDTFSIADVNSSRHEATVTEVVKNKTAQVTYSVTARVGLCDIDKILPDSFMEEIAEEESFTLTNLFNKLKNEGYIDFVPNLGINQNYQINKNFGYTGLTVRQLLEWATQLAGINISSFNARGSAMSSVTIFHPSTVILPLEYTDNNIKSIDLAEYTVPQIDKIWFGTDSSDIGVSYGTGNEQLSMPYNPLIDGDTFLQPLYDKVHSLQTYTPMRIETFLQDSVLTDWTKILTYSWMNYTKNGTTYSCPIFNWEISPSGIVLEGTGNYSRTVSNSLISSEIAQNGKYNKFKRTLDSTVSTIADLQGDVSSLNQTAASLTLEVAGKVGADNIISTINQTAETITIDASKINLNGAVAVSARAQGGDEEEGDTESDSLKAMLTIEPTQSQMASDYSRSGLYNNCFSISKYNSSGTRYANARMYADSFAMGGVEIVDQDQTWIRRNTVYFSSGNVSDSSLGYGSLLLFNPQAMAAAGETTNVAIASISSNLTADNTAVGSIILSSTYGTSHVPHIYFYPYGYKTGAQDFARIDNEAYKFYNNVNGETSVLQAQYDKTHAWFPHQNGKDTMYHKDYCYIGSTSSTTTYSYISPSALDIYNGNTSPNASYTSTGLTIKSNNSTTTYSTLSSSLNLYDGNTRASLLPSGVIFYEDNGSGTSASKGHYTGKELTVGLATSGSTYTLVSPTQITWNNSGQSKVNKLVPQGASVIEHGTSSGWTYRKWSDGTYECWKTIPYSQRVEGVWDDDFYVEVNAQSYPVTFASAPYEVVSISSGDKSLFIANTSTGPSTTKTAKYLFMRPTNAGTTITVNLTFYVKGVLP